PCPPRPAPFPMRQAGTLSNREQAQQFADYLLTQGITVRVEREGTAWAIWARDEDQLPQTIDELRQFVAEPTAERYRSSGQAASALRKQQERDDRQRKKNFIEVRGRWESRAAGQIPVTVALILASVFVSVATKFADNRDSQVLRIAMFAPIPTDALAQMTWTPTQAIESGELWRLVTPIFIHFNPMHLLMDMYALYLFGSLVERRRGSWRYAVLVLGIAVTSNWGQYYFPAHFKWAGQLSIMFGGMSGVDFGLFGYIWIKSRFDPRSQFFISPGTVLMSLLWFFLCITGLVGPIANWAHGVGLLYGSTVAYAPMGWLQLKRWWEHFVLPRGKPRR
ncbi:MAG TPA: rhomboid family intramembrane serine protease, partial [Pirellulales bacterium]